MDRPPDIEAIVTFLPTEHGGRKGYARSDYRPQFYYDGHDWDAIHDYPDVELVEPGQTARSAVDVSESGCTLLKLKPGSAFLIREVRKS
ncbi:MAG: hypothetical protein U1F35_03300 [Steroidobacteraceae bacterium]